MAYDDVTTRDRVDDDKEDVSALPEIWNKDESKIASEYRELYEENGERGISAQIILDVFGDTEKNLDFEMLEIGLTQTIVNLFDRNEPNSQKKLESLFDILIDLKDDSLDENLKDQVDTFEIDPLFTSYLTEFKEILGEEAELEDMNKIVDRLLIVKKYIVNGKTSFIPN